MDYTKDVYKSILNKEYIETDVEQELIDACDKELRDIEKEKVEITEK